MKATVSLLLVLMFLTGCDQLFPPKKKPRPPMTSESLSNVPAQSVTREINGNQLIVIDVPVLSYGVMREMQHCFVWRDREFKTASLACPGSKDLDLSPDPN